jgi:3-oxoacyl-(acyl-carrier-protein) synthase
VNREPVYVTGVGAVSCLGTGVEALWESLCAGQCGLRPITRFDLEKSPYALSGEVTPLRVAPFEECGLSAGGQFAAEAAGAALNGFPSERRASVAVVLATNFGPSELLEHELAQGQAPPVETGYRLESGFFAEDVRRVAHRLCAGGPLVSISLSCASGGAAIAYALDLIRWGRTRAALACGYDSVQRTIWAGLASLRVMALPSGDGAAAVRPFDMERSGTVFSEGAGCLLLESASGAAERGAEPLAELAGAAANNNAYHMTHADEQGQGTTAVMQMALEDAGVPAESVDVVYAHGTGTKLNDIIEARAFRAVFGDRAGSIPVVSLKGALGHAMGAASSLEAVAAVMTLRTGLVPPTVGLRNLDPECGLDVVRGSVRHVAAGTVLCNSAGIGGANAAVVLRKPSRPPATE